MLPENMKGMMRFYTVLAFAFAGLLFVSCDRLFPERMLYGSWQATLALEAQDTLPIDPSAIRLSFDEGGRYSYRSTLNYREAGYFRLEGDLLYTRDTLHADTTLERFVKVAVLTSDSLVLLMRTPDHKARTIRFRKISPSRLDH